jgi:hypothetical protein
MDHGQWVDYFQVQGYRKFCIQVIVQSLDDLRLPDASARAMVLDENGKMRRIDLREQARTWLMVDAKTGAQREPGLHFEDCVTALGMESRLHWLRELIATKPEELRKTLLHAMSVESNAALSDALQEDRYERPKVGNFDASWLFAKPQEPQLAGE